MFEIVYLFVTVIRAEFYEQLVTSCQEDNSTSSVPRNVYTDLQPLDWNNEPLNGHWSGYRSNSVEYCIWSGQVEGNDNDYSRGES